MSKLIDVELFDDIPDFERDIKESEDSDKLFVFDDIVSSEDDYYLFDEEEFGTNKIDFDSKYDYGGYFKNINPKDCNHRFVSIYALKEWDKHD